MLKSIWGYAVLGGAVTLAFIVLDYVYSISGLSPDTLGPAGMVIGLISTGAVLKYMQDSKVYGQAGGA